jgi:N-hydroxyarylamine O-acetyltransferase
MHSLSTPAYLRRIAYDGPTTPSAATLRALHVAHLRAVPFENLDIHLGRPIVLDEARLTEKIVGERRGGFCYELNGAFAGLLEALGFRVTRLSAEVARGDGTFGPDFDHLLLRVDLDEPLLADVGFGDLFLEPLRLTQGVQEQAGRAFRLDREGDHQVLLQCDDGQWSPQYRFTLVPRELRDFASMCHFHQTSPESHFTHKRVCTLATLEGRITLTEERLIVTANGARNETPITGEDEFRRALRDRFGIAIDGANPVRPMIDLGTASSG